MSFSLVPRIKVNLLRWGWLWTHIVDKIISTSNSLDCLNLRWECKWLQFVWASTWRIWSDGTPQTQKEASVGAFVNDLLCVNEVNNGWDTGWILFIFGFLLKEAFMRDYTHYSIIILAEFQVNLPEVPRQWVNNLIERYDELTLLGNFIARRVQLQVFVHHLRDLNACLWVDSRSDHQVVDDWTDQRWFLSTQLFEHAEVLRYKLMEFFSFQSAEIFVLAAAFFATWIEVWQIFDAFTDCFVNIVWWWCLRLETQSKKEALFFYFVDRVIFIAYC